MRQVSRFYNEARTVRVTVMAEEGEGEWFWVQSRGAKGWMDLIGKTRDIREVARYIDLGEIDTEMEIVK